MITEKELLGFYRKYRGPFYKQYTSAVRVTENGNLIEEWVVNGNFERNLNFSEEPERLMMNPSFHIISYIFCAKER